MVVRSAPCPVLTTGVDGGLTQESELQASSLAGSSSEPSSR